MLHQPFARSEHSGNHPLAREFVPQPQPAQVQVAALVPGAFYFYPIVLQADAIHNLCICLFHTAHIAAETILIQFFMGVDIPEPASIGRNFVR